MSPAWAALTLSSLPPVCPGCDPHLSHFCSTVHILSFLFPSRCATPSSERPSSHFLLGESRGWLQATVHRVAKSQTPPASYLQFCVWEAWGSIRSGWPGGGPHSRLSPSHLSLPPMSQSSSSQVGEPSENVWLQPGPGAPPTPRPWMELGGPLMLASPGIGFCERMCTPGAQICLSLFLSL